MSRPFLVGALVVLATTAAHGQDTLRVVRRTPTSALIVIGRDTMIAFVQDTAREFLVQRAQVRGLQREVMLKDSLLASTEEVLRLSDTTIARQRRLIAQLDTLSRGYRDVAAGYRKLSEPKLSFVGGAGATGSSHSPALLVGLDILRVSVWGFLQEENAGGGLAVRLRLW